MSGSNGSYPKYPSAQALQPMSVESAIYPSWQVQSVSLHEISPGPDEQCEHAVVLEEFILDLILNKYYVFLI